MEDHGTLENTRDITDGDILKLSGVTLDQIKKLNQPLSEEQSEHWCHDFWEPPEIDSSTYLPTGEPAFDAFWHTLVVDQGLIPGSLLSLEETQGFREEYMI
ncbi:hypothetical protein G7Y89_g3146 [Cudoniella acicularis]|uniref:Uncharacterized protein n=1 Tax=Cudoniella acicularis TaxID=354080 RepID=A0A8H4RRY9_9HELO|nr:hypothetical protein G7Y89_g3146 [Cudoniella acicularis]